MNLAPEDLLLTQCCRVGLGDDCFAEVSALLRHGIDWDYVLDASVVHGVAPLLWHGLERMPAASSGEAAVPEAVRAQLASLHRNSGARNRRLYRVLAELAATFRQAGIEAMALKDLALARTGFPDPALRPIGDLDILIHRHDYPRMAECMARLGFFPVPSADCPFAQKYAWGQHFRRAADNVWVDVQWGVLQLEWDTQGEGNFDFEVDRLWRNAAPLSLDGESVLVPRTEDMLFHLCMHLEGHRYGELILLCDIAALLRQHGRRLDWEYLAGLSRRYGVSASLYYSLLITERLFPSVGSVPLAMFEPDYLSAPLHEPVFGNLTDLHTALDDIHRAAAPPDPVMDHFESVTRRQALAAMRLYSELDKLAEALAASGAGRFCWDGTPSCRIYPSEALEPFSRLRLLVADADGERLFQALSARGFEQRTEAGAPVFVTRVLCETNDPAAGRVPLQLEVRATVSRDLTALLRESSREAPSKKHLALQTLRAAGASSAIATRVPVRLDLFVLSVESILAYLAAGVGRSQESGLFRLCNLLEFVRGQGSLPGPSTILEVACAHGIGAAAESGMLLAGHFTGSGLTAGEPEGTHTASVPMRLFRLARYGASALERYTDLKSAFYCALTLLTTRGLGAKLRYLAGGIPILRGLAAAGRLVRTRVWTRRARRLKATDLAYWAQPEAGA